MRAGLAGQVGREGVGVVLREAEEEQQVRVEEVVRQEGEVEDWGVRWALVIGEEGGSDGRR